MKPDPDLPSWFYTLPDRPMEPPDWMVITKQPPNKRPDRRVRPQANENGEAQYIRYRYEIVKDGVTTKEDSLNSLCVKWGIKICGRDYSKLKKNGFFNKEGGVIVRRLERKKGG